MAARQRTLDLMERKDALETELSAQFSILSANQSTMNTPLVDPEGFPRADIDVWAVRHARVRIIELRNDLKQIVDDIAVALTAVRSDDAAGRERNGVGAVMMNGTSHNEADSPEDLEGFVRVDGVAPGSPAAVAVRFGRYFSSLFIQLAELSHQGTHT
jgi:26S proteasome regulatory subunit N4